MGKNEITILQVKGRILKLIDELKSSNYKGNILSPVLDDVIIIEQWLFIIEKNKVVKDTLVEMMRGINLVNREYQKNKQRG